MQPIRSGMCAIILLLVVRGGSLEAQTEVGFIEKFALAEDRREVLAELIPGTEDYFFFHCLHQQNTKQLDQAAATIADWQAKQSNSQRLRVMQLRQVLLSYNVNPTAAMREIERELNIELNHRQPRRDRAADLPASLDARLLDATALIQQAVATDPGLAQLDSAGVWRLADQKLPTNQLRAFLGRVERADLPGTLDRIVEELSLRDSKGYGWAGVHHLLTREQMDVLAARLPILWEVEAFVRDYAARLAPTDSDSLSDPETLRSYLERLASFVDRLPPSQNNLKALVHGNVLKLNISQGIYDKPQFLKYLALPRRAVYYRPVNPRAELVDLSFSLRPQILLQPIGDDSGLVRRHLERFLVSEGSVNDYASFLERSYLDRVFAEAKILNGVGDLSAWYAKLDPEAQKQLRDRVELRFSPENAAQVEAEDAVELKLELKNVPKLIARVYEISLRNYYRNNTKQVGPDIDLDGLIPNAERALEFDLPADRRHMAVLPLPELSGRGVWVIDLLGAGTRSRALVRKGQLVALERFGDAGQVLRIVDESGKHRPTAFVELGGVAYRPNEQGDILLPYASETVSRSVVIVDGDFASMQLIQHRSENYQLSSSFLISGQSLISGNNAQVTIASRLSCNDQAIRLSLLQNPTLRIVATDLDGIVSTQTVGDLELSDTQDIEHEFLVPSRLARLDFEFQGQVRRVSNGEWQTLSVSHSVQCNGIQRTSQIVDSFLQHNPDGYDLFLVGRGGEAAVKYPVQVSVKSKWLTTPINVTLASDEKGRIRLGRLQDVQRIEVSGQGISPSTFQIELVGEGLPQRIQIAEGNFIVLPTGPADSREGDFLLLETRRRAVVANFQSHLKLAGGQLTIDNLPAGRFLLRDLRSGIESQIHVVEGVADDGWIAGPLEAVDVRPISGARIVSDEVSEKGLRIKIAGAGAGTRVHVIAEPFRSTAGLASRIQLPIPKPSWLSLPEQRLVFVDSLRLDEEYDYILQRRTNAKFPGNMLPQPSLLIHPWEIAVTENERRDAAEGEALPSNAPRAAAADDMLRRELARATASNEGLKSYDFLAMGSRTFANIEVKNGEIVLPREAFENFGLVTVHVVDPNGGDSRVIPIELENVSVRDNRLSESFQADKTLTQVQQVQLLQPGDQLTFSAVASPRMQTYGTLEGVFQLYSTLLDDPEWEKFRFCTRWQTLDDAEKFSHYSQAACHELNLFLFHKDPEFFNRVVRPFIAQKMDKQFVDHWLLGDDLTAYTELVNYLQLNAFERVLLSKRGEARNPSTLRWLRDEQASNPLDPIQLKASFDAALRGSALEATPGLYGVFAESAVEEANIAMEFDMAQTPFGGGGFGGASGGRAMRGAELKFDKKQKADLFMTELGRGQQPSRLFQNISKTLRWAETHYYHVPLNQQTPELIGPSPFWLEYAEQDGLEFLPKNIALPVGSLNEALLALAIIDLPMAAKGIEFKVVESELRGTAKAATILLLESIVATEADKPDSDSPDLLLGQEIYLTDPSVAGQGGDMNLPVDGSSLIKGTAYTVKLVVTNPSNQPRSVSILAQLPQGSLPLASSRMVGAWPIQLAAYATQQIDYTFYFPEAGQFDHYGAQASADLVAVAGVASSKLRVLDEPESVDQATWAYVADWGTDEQVQEFLRSANWLEIELSRIAFRMADRKFFNAITQQLADEGYFDDVLWGYAVKHNDSQRLGELLARSSHFASMVGPALDSPLLKTNLQSQRRYEHIDFRPLVLARTHELGNKNIILNAELDAQYRQLLELLAHQVSPTASQRLQLCYYLLLQNRIELALRWFETVQRGDIHSEMQYDYFDCYLSFYREDYQRAADIAAKYVDYPVRRWSDVFSEVIAQIKTRDQLLASSKVSETDDARPRDDASDPILARDTDLQQQADAAAVLSVVLQDGQVHVGYRKLDKVKVNFYLMDIELLFSRRPFVGMKGQQLPPILPNRSSVVNLSPDEDRFVVEIPGELQNRNLIVEVGGGGLSRSVVLTSGALEGQVVESYGQIRVRQSQARTPVTKAYVKVYARHRDGSVKFYKDGYTDLRGYFDYATISTDDLATVERFALLVLDEELGAQVYEAAPPTR